MKFNKEMVMVLVLTSLLLSALGAAFYFYKQNEKAKIENNQIRIVYIASNNIKQGDLIEKKDLKQINIAKKFVLTEPLLEKEIIGKYAKENIYKNDQFRKEKLSKTKAVEKVIKNIIDDFVHNSYNMRFTMFRNPNFALKKGDIINIISVFPTTKPKVNGSSNSVQYVASGIKIIGFLTGGKESDKTITLKEVKSYNKKTKKMTIKKVEVKADELILDIDSKVLLSLTDDYNRGSQLWMVKTKKKTDKKVIKKDTKTSKKIVKRNYPYKMYKARDSYISLQATIHYSDQEDAASTNKKTIKVNSNEVCNINEKLLVGISNNVHLRTGPSNRNKIVRTVRRNYIIPYIEKINPTWFKTCDGYYVHILEANIINKNFAMEKLK